jgi:SNF2 family DNA or RNA helicase
MIFLHGTFWDPDGVLSASEPSGLFLWAEAGEQESEREKASTGDALPHPWALAAPELRRTLDDLQESLPDLDLCLPKWDAKPENFSSPPPPPKRRGRKPKNPPADPLETAALKGVAPGADSRENGSPLRTFFATLPTLDGLPLPSSPLIAEMPASKKTPHLQPWQVEGAVFAPREAVLFLSALSAALQSENVSVKIASDLEFCLHLLRFAGAMAARQNFLPSVIKNPAITAIKSAASVRVTWQPVFAGLERDRCEALIRSVPGLCRAISNSPSSSPLSSRRFVLGSLELLTDVLVRLKQSPRSTRSKEEFAHREWIARLLALDPAPCHALAELIPQLKEWRRPIAAAADAPYRLCLQLEEPNVKNEINEKGDLLQALDPDNVWRLNYYVQPLDDPTLQVKTGWVFAPKAKKAKQSLELLTRGKTPPQEFAAQALGQVGKLFPPVEDSLRSAAPDGCPLSSENAFHFLESAAAPLIEAGFVVRFPSWWTAKGYQKLFGLRASVKGASKKMAAQGQGQGKMSLDSLLKVDWEVMLEGEAFSLKELEKLATLKDTMVNVRGRWVALSQEELRKALNFLKKAPPNASVRDVLRSSLGLEGEFAPKDAAFDGEPAFAEMLTSLTQSADGIKIPPVPIPEGLEATLRPYQARGFSWLTFSSRWGLGACLADDMGLGKTLQTLTLLQNRLKEGETRPALLIAPTSVLENWRREAERFLPGLRVLVHHGTQRARSEAFGQDVEGYDLVATSFALLVRDHAAISRIRWSGVILDEAQNIKNHDSKQAKAARQLTADYRVALTGTPVENHVGDLWSLMEFLNPGLLGTQATFKRHFFNPIQNERDQEAATRLKNVTGPFILRRLKTDKTIIDDLPEKIVTKTFCKLKKEQASLYAAVTKEAERALEEAEGIQRRGLVLATLTRLKQICNHPAQYLGETGPAAGRSGKLERLEELAEEALAAGDAMLIFTQYAEMGEILRHYLQETLGEETLFLHGGVPKARRDVMVRRFQEGEARLFVLSLKAGGTGLNLTQANHVVLFDRWWNPAVEQQAIDRAFRIGQKKNVQVHAFVCQGTLEERIDEMIESKREIAGMTVRSGEGWLTELSTTELKDLFTLSRSAVAEE